MHPVLLFVSSSCLLFACRVERTPVGVPVDIVSPPLGERSRLATGSRHGKTKEEYHNLRSAIHTSGDKVVPFDELVWAVFPEVPLANITNDKIDPDRRVNTNHEVAHIPEYDRQVQITPYPLLREEFMEDVKGNGKEES